MFSSSSLFCHLSRKREAGRQFRLRQTLTIAAVVVGLVLGVRQTGTKMEVGIVIWIRVTAVLEVVAALFLAKLRFCMHYCIDCDTCSKKINHLHAFFFWTVH